MNVVAVLLALWSALAVAGLRQGPTGDPVWEDLERRRGTRGLALFARPLRSSRLVRRGVERDVLPDVTPMLRATGRYGGSLEVFWSAQAFAFLAAASLGAVVFLTPMHWFWRTFVGLVAALVGVWPYMQLRTAYKERIDAVLAVLPDFAELLVMVLPTMGVKAALTFCASHSDGPVADEMRRLVQTLVSRPSDEQQVFADAAERLGPREAHAFLSSLYTSYMEDTRLVGALAGQAELMRRVQFQRRRAQMKQLPTRLVFVFAVHFMPLLFVLAFLPVVIGLARGMR